MEVTNPKAPIALKSLTGGVELRVVERIIKLRAKYETDRLVELRLLLDPQ